MIQFGAGGASSFRADIEGLRAIAVGLVVASHARVPGFAGGFIGVDVFFVISGYLITGLLVRELHHSGRIDLMQFYARRARRLLPAAFLTIVITLLVGALLLAPLEQRLLSGTAIYQFGYVSNFYFIKASLDYFTPQASLNPLLHTWSLSAEEQFYFFWPSLLLFLNGLNGNRGVILGTAALTAASFALCVWLTWTSPNVAFYSAPTRVWEFGIGGLAIFLRVRSAAWSNVIGGLGLAATVLSGIAIDDRVPFPGFVDLVPVLGTAAILISGAGGRSTAFASRILALRPMQFIGKRSYSWYLWHWPVLVFADILIPDISLLMRIALAGVSFGLAAATFALVENPIRKHGFLVSRAGLSLAGALLMTVTGIGIAGLVRQYANYSAGNPQLALYTEALQPMKLDENGCIASFTEELANECGYGSATATTRIVLFGDSHAAQWFPPLLAMAEQQNWNLITLTKSSCPTAETATLYNFRLKRLNPECDRWRAAAIKRILEIRPAAIVIANYSTAYLLNPSFVHAEHGAYAEWRTNLRSTLQILGNSGSSIIILRDTPHAPFSIPTCLARATSLGQFGKRSCDIDRHSSFDDRLWDEEKQATAGIQNLYLLDLSDEICQGDICPAMKDGIVVLRDNNHLSNNFSRSLMGALAKEVLPAIANSRQQNTAPNQ